MSALRVSESQKNSYTRWIPYAGIALGTATGVLQRAVNASDLSSFFSDKCSSACRNAFSGSSFLKGVNHFKQWEIKNFALLTPLIPLALKIGYDVANDKRGKGLKAWIAKAAKKNLRLGVHLGTAALFSLTGTSYCSSLGMCTKTGFDLSGHLMMKTAAASILDQLIRAEKESRPLSRKLQVLYTSAYALSDAVLIHATVASCHTLSEVIAGAAWGLGIVALSNLAASKAKSVFEKPKTV